MALSANNKLKVISGAWVTRGYPLKPGEYLLTIQSGKTKASRFLFATHFDGHKFAIPDEWKSYRFVAWTVISPFSGKSRLHEGSSYNLKNKLLYAHFPDGSPF